MAKLKPSTTKKNRHTVYKTTNRRLNNKLTSLEKYVEENPNDLQAKKALSKIHSEGLKDKPTSNKTGGWGMKSQWETHHNNKGREYFVKQELTMVDMRALQRIKNLPKPAIQSPTFNIMEWAFNKVGITSRRGSKRKGA